MTEFSPSTSQGPNGNPLPVGMRLGVTGHRKLEDPEMICGKIDEVLTELAQWFEGRAYNIEVLTSLADGADRLVPKCILARARNHGAPDTATTVRPQVGLHAVLPMPAEIYYKTFFGGEYDSPEGAKSLEVNPSVQEFEGLLAQANSIVIAPRPEDCPNADSTQFYGNEDYRQKQYRWAGEYIVDRCDILMAIWNEKKQPPPGSTAQIMDYARKIGRSIVWIHAITGKVSWLISGDDLAAQYFYLRQYNNELNKIRVDPTEIEQRYSDLAREAAGAGLALDEFSNLRAEVLPRFVQAGVLSAKYQSRYFRCGTIGYLCAAGAVCVAAVLSLVFRESWHVLYLFEALLILTAAACGWLLKKKGWQRKWIDYRFLAERLRATCFLYIAGIPFEPEPSYPDTHFDWLPEGWVTLALRKVWSGLPVLNDHRFRDPSQVRALGAFLYRAWMQDQEAYYHKASEKNKGRNEKYELLSYVLLGLTLFIALTYGIWDLFTRNSPGREIPAEWYRELPHVAAVAFPAITSALAGIMIFRHYARNAERYSSMNHYLEAVGKQMLAEVGLSGNEEKVPDLSNLRQLVQDADRAMAHEHEGWRTVFGVRLPGPG